jgi:hypothetical protein
LKMFRVVGSWPTMAYTDPETLEERLESTKNTKRSEIQTFQSALKFPDD